MTADRPVTGSGATPSGQERRRFRLCAESFGVDDEYSPKCCRWPKSCSPYPYPEWVDAGLVPEANLEPPPTPPAPVQETCGCGMGGDEPSSDHSSWCPLTREHGSADDIAATINRAVRIVTAAGYQDSKGEWHPPAPAQVPLIDSSLIAAHPVTADQTPAQEAGSGRHVQSAAGNLTSGPGMSSELDGGRQAAVEAVARWLADRYGERPVRDIGPWQKDAAELLAEVAALSQPGGPT